MVRFVFTLNGYEVPEMLYVWLPYLRPGGIMTIKGSKFVISPVVADVGLSVCSDSIFVRWHRTRLTFFKMMGYVCVDGVRTSVDMVYSQIYNNDNSKNSRYNTTTLTHYLFCRYGVNQAFKNIGVDIKAMSLREFNTHTYPPEDWVVFTTPQFQLQNRGRVKQTGRSDIALVIPRSQMSKSVTAMMAAFFYVADQHPDSITPDDYDDVKLWLVALGKMALTDGGSTLAKILEHMTIHINSVDGYLDNMALTSIKENGIEGINNVYDLFYYLNDNMPRMVAEVGGKIASMYGKRLTVLSYVAEDITMGITRILFEIQRERNKPTKRSLTIADVGKIFKKQLPFPRILNLNRGKAFVKSLSTASDCMLHKVTSAITMQTECGNGGQKKRSTFGEEQHAHISNIEVGAITNLPDRDPTGRSSLNHMAMVDQDGTIMRNPKLIDLLNDVQADIERR